MPKLYFRYGTVGSAKTMNMLAVAHNYENQGKKIILMKPEIDTRFGASIIKSRIGIFKTADVIITSVESIMNVDYTDISCVLIDEAQFCTSEQIDALRHVSLKTPVICYGLRTDFRTQLFSGSKRLMEIADTIEEIKNTCSKCTKKGIINLRHQGGVKIIDGPQIILGAEETYVPVCFEHYFSS